MLAHRNAVIRALLTYTDGWQPATTSLLQLKGASRNASANDGLHPSVLGTFEERIELARRMESLSERDRRILFFWYVEQLPLTEIADAVGLSTRQCSRRRAAALRELLEP